MPRPLRLALGLALAVALASPLAASAEIIDFNPATDTVPQILTPDEMARYNTLVGQIRRPSVSSTASPDGRYVLVTVQGSLQVLDTTTKALSPYFLTTNMSVGSPLLWTSPTEAMALTWMNEVNAQGQVVRRYDYAQTVLNFETRTLSSTVFPLPTVPNRNLQLATGRPLLRTADGTYHMVGYTTPRGFEIQTFERPTFDGRPKAEIDAIGLSEPVQSILQATTELVAISMKDGSLTKIGEIPAGTDIGTPVNSLTSRPGSNTVAYVTRPVIPWAGKVIAGRANRGGGMPTSYFNTQENLGLIPEDENRHITGTALHLTDLVTGVQTTIENSEHTPGKFRTTLWTADGQWLVVVVDTPSVLAGREHPIYEYSAGIEIKLFTPDGREPDGGVAPVSLKALNPPMDASSSLLTPLDGTRMLVRAGVNTTRHLYIVDIANRSAPPEPVYTGDAYPVTYAVGGSTFIGVLGDVTDPGELYVAQAGSVDTTKEKLTESNPQLDGTSTIAYKVFTYQTSHGYTLKGTYVYPSDWPFPPPKPMPAVVWQEGGPGGQMLNTWGTNVESPYSLLPNFGIPVIVVNGAGRMSNGSQFYSDMADGTNYGQRDIQDVKEAVDHLVEMDVVDPKAVGVTGCSYGGYFTLQSLTTYPDFYAAGNSQCSLNDMLYEYNFGWSPFLAYLIGNSSTGDPAEFIKDSPTYNAHKIKAPLLQFHGTNDFLPFEHITNVHDQVMMNGTESQFFRGIGYGHGIGNIGNAEGQLIPNSGANGQRYAFQLQLTWFRKHLGLMAPVLDSAAPIWINPILPAPLRPQPVLPSPIQLDEVR